MPYREVSYETRDDRGTGDSCRCGRARSGSRRGSIPRRPGRIEHHQTFDRGGPHRFHGHVPYRFYGYVPTCSWTQGYWGYQLYVDANGQGWYVPQWVPAQQVCN